MAALVWYIGVLVLVGKSSHLLFEAHAAGFAAGVVLFVLTSRTKILQDMRLSI